MSSYPVIIQGSDNDIMLRFPIDDLEGSEYLIASLYDKSENRLMMWENPTLYEEEDKYWYCYLELEENETCNFPSGTAELEIKLKEGSNEIQFVESKKIYIAHRSDKHLHFNADDSVDYDA